MAEDNKNGGTTQTPPKKPAPNPIKTASIAGAKAPERAITGKRQAVSPDDEEAQRRQLRRDAHTRLDFSLFEARPAVFSRPHPANPDKLQFMTLMAGTIDKETGKWEGWACTHDKGVQHVNLHANELGNWKFAGYCNLDTPKK